MESRVTSKIRGETVVVSDIHLGARMSNKKEFKKFLDYLKSEKNLGCVIINGDGIDFWRRDDAGAVFESADVIHKLAELKEKAEVVWPVGNHDSRMRYWKNNNYQFKFPEELMLRTPDINYRVKHGHQYDPTQIKILFDPLCYRTNDDVGGALGETWKGFTGFRKVLGNLLLRTLYYPQTRKMLQTPKERKIINIVEENAKNDVKKGEYLIIGHTHNAMVDNYARLANSGAWVKGIPNTYLRIKGSNVKLEEF